METCQVVHSQIIALSFKGGSSDIIIDPIPDESDDPNRVKGEWEIDWGE